ncbi:MAG: tetratricopeptide repeat protein [Kiritimatiellae bacterium]|nr:tetratricopeptide repeat protein [Kiritimatiellia bacterium]MCO5069497.1 tetratricopeptide repeat protein [Kiritimatiellia bacterium]
MRWIGSLLGLSALAVLVAGIGCTAIRPDATRPAATVSVKSSATSSPDDLRMQLSEARLEQERLERELAQSRDDLYRTALALKEIKVRLEEVTVYAVSNAARMVAIERQLGEVRRASAGGGSEQVKTLRAVLENEKQAQQRLEALVAERDREVRDLRAAVRANEAELERRTRGAADGKDPAVAPPQARVVATPAPPAAQAPASAAGATTVSVYRLVVEGNRALKTGNVARARAMFERARTREPNLSGALLGLAAIAYQVNDLAEGRRLVEEVLSQDKQNAQALGLRGMIRWREGDAKDGVRDCARAVDLDPNDPLLRKFYGITLHARGQSRDAIREMRKAVAMDPSDAEAQLNLAILLATDSRPALDEARSFYEKALAAGVARDSALDAILGLSP